MQVLILAAGKGKRMGDLTKNNHKSLLMVNETESFLTRLQFLSSHFGLYREIADLDASGCISQTLKNNYPNA